MFWEQVLINYLSTVFSGITLALLGFVVYKIYKKIIQIKVNPTEQENKYGDNTMKIGKQYNINLTEKSSEEIIKKILK